MEQMLAEALKDMLKLHERMMKECNLDYSIISSETTILMSKAPTEAKKALEVYDYEYDYGELL